MTETLDLSVNISRPHHVFMGFGRAADDRLWEQCIGRSSVLLITDENLHRLVLPQWLPRLRPYRHQVMVVPAGDSSKSLACLATIYDRLLAGKFARDDVILAFGGGMVGDLAGFAAATYQRGMRLIHLPTTLLAQVDSAIGGKTGVNHPQGKNMIGAFYPPDAVVIDPQFLSSLPQREFRSGIAEVIKYALIKDADWFQRLAEKMPALLAREPDFLLEAIARSCRHKIALIEADEREQGCRALLNLGHSFGHAIEAEDGYKNWLHGEAVAVGLRMAAHLSLRLGWLTENACQRISDMLQEVALPLRPMPGLTADKFLQWMAHDKKVQYGKRRLVLLQALGQAVVSADYSEDILRSVLREFCDA